MNFAPFIRFPIAPLWAWHERSPYLGISRSLQRNESMSLDERRHVQWRKLVDLIKHAWNNSPYYRKKYEDAGFVPGDLREWSDFQLLPVLTKKDITENASEMLCTTAKGKNLVPRKTSGSTGVSLNFFVDDAEYQFKRGVQLYRDQWTGWRLGEWKAMVWGNPSYMNSMRGRIRNLLLERCFSLDTLKMNEEMMKSFASEILRRRPTMLFGHAHSLFLFASFWREQNLPEYRFRGILSTAMVLHEHERRVCETVFQTPVFDRYGCEEVSLIASECEVHNGLHVNTDSLNVEIMSDKECAPGGVPGKVVVTDLCNTAMPFIRYEVGDTAICSEEKCSCGRTYPLLKKVMGRIADYLRTPQGEWISGISLTENFATLIPGIHQIQIVQEKPDFIRLRIARNSRFDNSSELLITDMVRKRFGEAMTFAIEFVSSISPEPSGKYRFSINRTHLV